MNIDDFLKFEKDNKLFDMEVSKVKFWHIIRFKIFQEIISSKNESNLFIDKRKKNNLIAKILKKTKQTELYFKRNPLTNLEETEVLIFNHNRKIKNSEFYECIYTDLISEKLTKSNLIIEEPLNHTHSTPTKIDNIYYTDSINILSLPKRLYFQKKILSNSEYTKIISDLIEKINVSFNQNFDHQTKTNFIVKEIAIHKSIYPYYKKIIQRSNPKVIIEVVSYSTSRFVINKIAKELSIPTIELQHGTTGYHHLAYNFQEEEIGEMFPDYQFVFGNYWKETTRYPIESNSIKDVGWPYYELKMKKNEHRKKIRRKKTILFISQITIGKQLSQIARKLSLILDPEEYDLIYKLHPAEYDIWEKNYSALDCSGIQVIDNNNKDMHYFFSKSDIQIGVYSTSIFEGLGYGLKTIIFKLYGHIHMKDLVTREKAYLVENIDEAIEIINNGENPPYYEDKNDFWTFNSLEKINKEIDMIIGLGDKTYE